jgi:hypothetical protein
MANTKRFTDAELAAEYWGADVWGHDELGAAADRMATILRFATTDHFDEAS